MKRKLLIVIGILLLLFIGQQLYQRHKYGGNLSFEVSNVSMMDSVCIEIYLNSKLVKDSSYNHQMVGYSRHTLNTSIGMQSFTFKAYKDKELLATEEQTIFVLPNRFVTVEFQLKNVYPEEIILDDELRRQSMKIEYNFFVTKRFFPLTFIN
ncbi:MAG: hypothetical protein LBG19_11225 [Prevotellaceae bacterium]|nr:hypothetical protein [Prevotellaceae bacterium]